ncbi:PrsW family glutamic-type intramembrane protease [Chloroflexota bacterium]
MFDYMIDFLASGFYFRGLQWHQLILGVGLALLFGAIWFAGYWTPILKKPWAWWILATSAFLSWVAVAFVQLPLQIWTGQAINHLWEPETITNWLLLIGIPQILLSGLVQEGSKLVPVVVYWWKHDKIISPRTGLLIGAVAGLGLGLFEATWAHNQILASGFTWEMVESGGLIMLSGFWERFFAVSVHIAMSAFAGYGLAKGWGWQFYLLAALVHSVTNYSVILLQKGIFTTIQLEIYVAVVAVIITAVVLRIRWKYTESDMADSDDGV